jgi:hypothetical protein
MHSSSQDIIFVLIIYINSFGLSVCDGVWEGGFMFLRAQRCRQPIRARHRRGADQKVGQHGRAGHEKRVSRED